MGSERTDKTKHRKCYKEEETWAWLNTEATQKTQDSVFLLMVFIKTEGFWVNKDTL